MTSVTLKDAEFYTYTSPDGSKKVVITFTTEENKDYESILPPTESDKPDEPTSQLFDVKVSFFYLFIYGWFLESLLYIMGILCIPITDNHFGFY